MNRTGQGALEYLLLIGGAVLIAAIVITLVISSGTTGVSAAELQSGEALCLSNSVSSTACPNTDLPAPISGTHVCAWESTDELCKLTDIGTGAFVFPS